MIVGALSPENRCPVEADLIDPVADLLRFVRDDQQGLLLIVPVHHMQNLRGHELEDNGIECLIPAEHDAGNAQHDHVEAEDDLECIHALFLGEENGDEIRPSAGRIRKQADAQRYTLDQSSENCDQKRVIRNGMGRNHVNKNGVDKDHHDRENGEFLPDIPEPDIDRQQVQRDVKRCVGDLQSPKALRGSLDQHRDPCHAARIESSGAHKDLDVKGHQQRGQNHHYKSEGVPFDRRQIRFHSHPRSFFTAPGTDPGSLSSRHPPLWELRNVESSISLTWNFSRFIII